MRVDQDYVLRSHLESQFVLSHSNLPPWAHTIDHMYSASSLSVIAILARKIQISHCNHWFQNVKIVHVSWWDCWPKATFGECPSVLKSSLQLLSVELFCIPLISQRLNVRHTDELLSYHAHSLVQTSLWVTTQSTSAYFAPRWQHFVLIIFVLYWHQIERIMASYESKHYTLVKQYFNWNSWTCSRRCTTRP